MQIRCSLLTAKALGMVRATVADCAAHKDGVRDDGRYLTCYVHHIGSFGGWHSLWLWPLELDSVAAEAAESYNPRT